MTQFLPCGPSRGLCWQSLEKSLKEVGKFCETYLSSYAFLNLLKSAMNRSKIFSNVEAH